MSQIKNVLLIGAGGNLGPTLLHALMTSPQRFKVSVLAREVSTYVAPAGVNIFKSNYTHSSLVSAFQGQDAVVVCIASSATLEQIKMIDAAIEAGVKRFVPAQFGSDPFNETALKRVPLMHTKKVVLEYLKEKEKELSWTSIENGAFLDWGFRIGAFGFDFPKATVNLYAPKYHEVKFSGTSLSTIGLAVARCLEAKYFNETRNKDVSIRSATFSQDDVIAILKKVSSKEFDVTHVNLDDSIEEAKLKLKNPDYKGVGLMIVGMILDPACGCNFDEYKGVDNKLLDLPTESLEELVKKTLRN